jgi:hypothetical protein
MNDENQQRQRIALPPDRGEVEVVERSLDAVFQGAQALGELTGGLGALALGASKLKETFGGGGQSAEPAPPPTEPPASSNESSQ